MSHAKWYDCENTRVPAAAVVIIFVVCTTLIWSFVIPWYVTKQSLEIWIPIIAVYIFTTVASASNFLSASFMNPGFLPKTADLEYADRQSARVIVNGTPQTLKCCRTCHYYRSPRTVHCHQCDYCVDNFDHHCPWVNNCVGRRNYRFFFGFLVCLTTHIIVTISICVGYLLQSENLIPTSMDPTPGIVLGVVAVSVLIGVPVFGLLCFHIFLIASGLTTYEYVQHKYPLDTSPFNKGPVYNCVFQLCGPEFPALLQHNNPNSDNRLKEEQTEFWNRLKKQSATHFSPTKNIDHIKGKKVPEEKMESDNLNDNILSIDNQTCPEPRDPNMVNCNTECESSRQVPTLTINKNEHDLVRGNDGGGDVVDMSLGDGELKMGLKS